MDEDKYLIVIDMQNDFIDGSLGTKEAQAIVPNVIQKIQDCEKQNYKIIFTRDTHEGNYLSTQEGIKLPIVHCVEHTPGWNINKKVCLSSHSANIVTKYSFGYYKWKEFFDLRYNHLKGQSGLTTEDFISEIQIIGLCTDICVVSNALILKSIFHNIPIIVDSNCCAGTSIKSHSEALNIMKNCQIEII